MRLLLIAFLVIVFGGVAYFFASERMAPMEGLVPVEGGERVLVSRARPGVFFRPATDDMKLVDAGWKSVRPDDGRMDAESVRLSFAVYKLDNKKLVTAIAEAPGEWEWIPAHHVPYHTLHSIDEPYENERRYESIFLLNANNDPFAEGLDSAELVLVYRGKFLLFFRKKQIFFEYREPIDPALAKNLELNPDYLRSFAERGRASCTLAFPSRKAMDGLKPRIVRLEPASDRYSREKLAKWLGELKHPGSGR